KHYRQKNPIRKNKTRRKIDGFVSGLEAGSRRPFLYPPSQLNNQSMMSSENRTHFSAPSSRDAGCAAGIS
ncbi:hypothetical protein ACC719_32935, partial [Rhizobium ruizarguesonis]